YKCEERVPRDEDPLAVMRCRLAMPQVAHSLPLFEHPSRRHHDAQNTQSLRSLHADRGAAADTRPRARAAADARSRSAARAELTCGTCLAELRCQSPNGVDHG